MPLHITIYNNIFFDINTSHHTLILYLCILLYILLFLFRNSLNRKSFAYVFDSLKFVYMSFVFFIFYLSAILLCSSYMHIKYSSSLPFILVSIYENFLHLNTLSRLYLFRLCCCVAISIFHYSKGSFLIICCVVCCIY